MRDCDDNEIAPEIYYLPNCAHSEVFLLLLNCVDLPIRLKSVADHRDWRSLTPAKTVPFLVATNYVASNSREVLETLVGWDSHLCEATRSSIINIQAKWMSIAEGYIQNEIKEILSDGFAMWAIKEFSAILTDFQLLSDRGRIYAAAIIMPYLRRIHYFNKIKPDSLILDQKDDAWGLLEKSCNMWHEFIVSYHGFRLVVR